MSGPIQLARCDATADVCHLCGDGAAVGRVIEIDGRDRSATVVFPDGAATVALDLVEARIGDDVLVHLGFAIARVATT